MNADFAEAIRIAGMTFAILGLVAVGFYSCHRVALWVKNLGKPRERVLARLVLGFLLGHSLTLTLGGFLLSLAVCGLHEQLPASERDEMLQAVWVCFTVGPVLACIMWASLRLICRRCEALDGGTTCA